MFNVCSIMYVLCMFCRDCMFYMGSTTYAVHSTTHFPQASQRPNRGNTANIKNKYINDKEKGGKKRTLEHISAKQTLSSVLIMRGSGIQKEVLNASAH